MDWYGGEPLLCFDTIEQIIDTLKRQGKLHGNWCSSITTNGTLLSKEIIAHIVDVWQLKSAHITIDGVEKDHNARKNVYLNGDSAFRLTICNLGELLENGVYVNLRIHLDHNNKSSFKIILNDLSHLFKYENLHLFPTCLFPPETKMPENYIKDDEKENLFYDVFQALIESNYKANIDELFPVPRSEGCFATRSNTVIIAPDGSLHSCVQDFDSEECIDVSRFSNFKYALDECKLCEYLPICLGGCLYNRNLKNTVRTPCVRNRYIIKPLLKLLLESYGEQ